MILNGVMAFILPYSPHSCMYDVVVKKVHVRYLISKQASKHSLMNRSLDIKVK